MRADLGVEEQEEDEENGEGEEEDEEEAEETEEEGADEDEYEENEDEEEEEDTSSTVSKTTTLPARVIRRIATATNRRVPKGNVARVNNAAAEVTSKHDVPATRTGKRKEVEATSAEQSRSKVSKTEPRILDSTLVWIKGFEEVASMVDKIKGVVAGHGDAQFWSRYEVRYSVEFKKRHLRLILQHCRGSWS